MFSLAVTPSWREPLTETILPTAKCSPSPASNFLLFISISSPVVVFLFLFCTFCFVFSNHQLVVADGWSYWARFYWKFLSFKVEFLLSTVTICTHSMKDYFKVHDSASDCILSLHGCPGGVNTSRQWLDATSWVPLNWKMFSFFWQIKL